MISARPMRKEGRNKQDEESITLPNNNNYRIKVGLGVYTSRHDLTPPPAAAAPITVRRLELEPKLVVELGLAHGLDHALSSSSTQLEYQSTLRLYASAPKTSSSEMLSTRLSISGSSNLPCGRASPRAVIVGLTSSSRLDLRADSRSFPEILRCIDVGPTCSDLSSFVREERKVPRGG
jgi:hypothetical protein